MSSAERARRPRAVLLSPATPAPTGGGLAMRAQAWVRTLQRTHDVVVVRVGRPTTGVGGGDGGGDLTDHSLIDASSVLQVVPRYERLLAVLAPRRDGRGVEDWVTVRDDTGPRLARLLGPAPIDRLVVMRLYLHDVACALRSHTRVRRSEMDLDDLESATRRSIASALLRQPRLLRALRTLRSAHAYARLERRVLPEYDQLWLAAGEDLSELPAHLRRSSAVFPNRVPMASERPPPAHGARFAFVGSLNYPPNVLAVHFLLSEVAPRLAQWLPGARILIAGRRASDRLRRRIDAAPGVEFLGAVPDAGGVLSGATAVLVPVDCGGGTKLKVIEALAHGVPVVGAPHAFRGLGLVDGQDMLIARTGRDYAAACARLASDDALRERLGAAGRARHAAAFALPEA